MTHIKEVQKKISPVLTIDKLLKMVLTPMDAFRK